MKIRLTAAMLLGLWLLSACSAPTSINSFPKENKPLKVGETFSISLEGNATTGYIWEYAMEPQGAFELVKYESKAKNNKDGAPSENLWVFKASKPVDGTLTFRYHRPWENSEPITLLRYDIAVK